MFPYCYYTASYNFLSNCKETHHPLRLDGYIYKQSAMIFGIFIALAFVLAFIWFEIIPKLDKNYQNIIIIRAPRFAHNYI